MYNKEELEKKTREEVRKIAKDLKIKRWYELPKCSLIESIISVCVPEDTENNVEEKESNSMDNNAHNNKSAQKPSNVKMEYLKNIQKGTIVAFKTMVRGHVKYKSAAVENYNQSKQLLKLVTNYGATYIIPFSDVIWVRTNSRWPKGVYELLKGVKKDG